MRKLGNCKNEDQIEKQLDKGHPALLVAGKLTQQIAPMAVSCPSSLYVVIFIRPKTASPRQDRPSSLETLPNLGSLAK